MFTVSCPWSAAPSKSSEEVSPFESFLLDLLHGTSGFSALSGLALLLDNLGRPGGGDEDGLPSKGESWKGGKLLKEA